MLRCITAGETHGKALVTIVEGMPSNVKIDINDINNELKKRQSGYGRGGRMQIETDIANILSGVRDSKTMGGPIAVMIENRDNSNWEEIMHPENALNERVVTAPRAGHADLTGAIKYNQQDIRNVLERASARETAARVAAGAVARQLLNEFDIKVTGYVKAIGDVWCDADYRSEGFIENIEKSQFRFADSACDEKGIAIVDKAKAEGESLGGIIEVVVQNVPAGLGSYVQYDRKLDANIAMAVMSVQAMKAVEFGMGFECGVTPGSKVHDEIDYVNGKYTRKTNNAGGVEGGMSNGEPIVLRVAMKPIPTLYKPLESVDIITKEKVLSSIERSDICAVPAASVVLENVVAFEIAKAFLDKFGGDSLEEIRNNYNGYIEHIKNF